MKLAEAKRIEQEQEAAKRAAEAEAARLAEEKRLEKEKAEAKIAAEKEAERLPVKRLAEPSPAVESSVTYIDPENILEH